MMILHKKQEKGFTLIEILIAIALLGIISAVVIPNVTGYINQGQERAYKSDVAAIQAAVDQFYADPANRGVFGINKGKKLYPLQCAMTDQATEVKCVTGGEVVVDPLLVAGDLKGADAATKVFLIDFSKIVGESKALKTLPQSAAAPDHTGGTGSYSYYVGTDGKVKSKWVSDYSAGPKAGVYP